MTGITRIKIVSDWDDWRVRMANDLAPAADAIYRQIFDLQPDTYTEECTKDEAIARYDWREGIDVILNTVPGSRSTLQEKFLDYHEWTVTFEERKTNGDPGAWYYCTSQYYFVGYATRYKAEGLLEFQAWMLLDLPAMHRHSDSGLIPWGNRWTRTPENPLGLRQNGRDGRGATFRFVAFADVPPACVIRSEYGRHNQPALFAPNPYNEGA